MATEVTLVIRDFEDRDTDWWADAIMNLFRYFGIDAELVEIEQEDV